MKVTPLDLRQQRFNTALRGYERGEVNAFLAEAADEYENALRENERLRQEVSKLEAVLKEHRAQETNLRNTLLTAQKLADDIKENASQEATRILREAEGRAELLLQKSLARLEDVQREIDGLRMKRREVETSLEGIIGTIQNTIAHVREQDAAHRAENIRLHRPRGTEGASTTSPTPHLTQQSQPPHPSHPSHIPHPSHQSHPAPAPHPTHPAHQTHLPHPVTPPSAARG